MPDITVASTTDSEEDVKLAAGFPAEGDEPEEGAESEEPKEAPAEADKKAEPEGEKPKSAAASEAAEEQEEDEEKPKGGRNKVQKRIDELTREKYDLKDENRELTRRLAEATAKIPKEAPATAAPKADEKPVRANFKSDDEYIDAVVDWRTKQRLAESRAEDERRASNANLQEIYDDYNAGVAEFTAEHPDFHEVLGESTLNIAPHLQAAIVSYGVEGPALAYHLATHPELVDALNGMMATRGVSELGRIHGRLFPDDPSEPEKKPAIVPAKPKPQAKKPPEPAKPVRTAPAPSTVPLDELSYQDYRRVRDSQERGRVRR